MTATATMLRAINPMRAPLPQETPAATVMAAPTPTVTVIQTATAVGPRRTAQMLVQVSPVPQAKTATDVPTRTATAIPTPTVHGEPPTVRMRSPPTTPMGRQRQRRLRRQPSTATTGDACPTTNGGSDQDRYGCTDSDGDGYSDPDSGWTVANGADAFASDATQWADGDSDGYGDNASGNSPMRALLNWNLQPSRPSWLRTATVMATPTSTMPSRANPHNGLTATATASEMKPRATKQMPVLQPVEPQPRPVRLP